MSEGQLRRVLGEYVHYFHRRPHQGIRQETPDPTVVSGPGDLSRVTAAPVLGGLHHDYRIAA